MPCAVSVARSPAPTPVPPTHRSPGVGAGAPGPTPPSPSHRQGGAAQQDPAHHNEVPSPPGKQCHSVPSFRAPQGQAEVLAQASTLHPSMSPRVALSPGTWPPDTSTSGPTVSSWTHSGCSALASVTQMPAQRCAFWVTQTSPLSTPCLSWLHTCSGTNSLSLQTRNSKADLLRDTQATFPLLLNTHLSRPPAHTRISLPS